MVLEMRKMKDSGIEWIGEIPEGWEIVPVRSCFDEVRTKNTDGQEQNALQFKSGNIISKTNFNASMDDYVADTITNYTVVLPDTVMINGLNLNYDFKSLRVALVKEKGVITSAYLAIFPDRKKISPQYATYLFKGYETKMAFHNMGAGIRKTLGYKEFKNQPLLLPSEKEQNKISAYLDSKCSHIDIMLSKIRSSIEEYKKLKQTVITQAVTKGVHGKREMKDSGVEWIGEIPKEWRKTQLRHCATIKSGITLGKSYSKDTVLIERPYLRVANVQGGYVDLNDLATIEVTPDEDLKYRLHSGDVLMTEGGDRDKLGRGCVWHGEIEPCLHQNHVFAVQTNESILLPEFLEYLTASDVGRSYFDITAIKTTNLACTSSSKVLAFTIPLPPVEEQIEIVSFIKKRSLELNKLIMKKELLVQELESYKKSLIYEVVTGKREV